VGRSLRTVTQTGDTLLYTRICFIALDFPAAPTPTGNICRRLQMVKTYGEINNALVRLAPRMVGRCDVVAGGGSTTVRWPSNALPPLFARSFPTSTSTLCHSFLPPACHLSRLPSYCTCCLPLHPGAGAHRGLWRSRSLDIILRFSGRGFGRGGGRQAGVGDASAVTPTRRVSAASTGACSPS